MVGPFAVFMAIPADIVGNVLNMIRASSVRGCFADDLERHLQHNKRNQYKQQCLCHNVLPSVRGRPVLLQSELQAEPVKQLDSSSEKYSFSVRIFPLSYHHETKPVNHLPASMSAPGFRF
jgi:hypothetical protein